VSGPQAARLPDWLHPLAAAASTVRAEELSRFAVPDGGGRPAAVLVLLGEGEGEGEGEARGTGPDVLLLERASTMRSHAGQPAFPGGAADPGDACPAATALREAREEVGLDPGGVEVFATLPGLWLPVSGFVVHPVLAWWREPSAVGVVDPAEVAAVARVPLAELVDPAHRCRVRHPSGWVGPAFSAGGLLVWGFTAGLLDRVLALGGWERPWDASDVRDLPADAVRLAARTGPGSSSPAREPRWPQILPR